MALVALLASCRDGLSARRQPSESASAARPRSSAPPATPTSVAAGFTVVAGGLVNPRGLAFAADGALYVAEAGVGGPTEIDLGRKRSHLVGNTGRVSMVRPGQSPRPLLSELPSIVTAAREEVGPTGLTFVGDTLYLLTASGGWDVGDPAFDNRLYRVAAEGALQPVLNLSELNLGEPSLARRQDPRADVPGGMPYGLVSLGGALYATDGNQDQVIKITPDGRAHRILEYPASDRALTGIAAGPDTVSTLPNTPLDRSVASARKGAARWWRPAWRFRSGSPSTLRADCAFWSTSANWSVWQGTAHVT